MATPNVAPASTLPPPDPNELTSNNIPDTSGNATRGGRGVGGRGGGRGGGGRGGGASTSSSAAPSHRAAATTSANRVRNSSNNAGRGHGRSSRLLPPAGRAFTPVSSVIIRNRDVAATSAGERSSISPMTSTALSSISERGLSRGGDMAPQVLWSRNNINPSPAASLPAASMEEEEEPVDNEEEELILPTQQEDAPAERRGRFGSMADELRSGRLNETPIPDPPEFSNLQACKKLIYQYLMVAKAGNSIVTGQITYDTAALYEEMEKQYRRWCVVLRTSNTFSYVITDLPPELTVSDLFHTAKITQGGRPLLNGESLWRRFQEIRSLVVNVLNPNWIEPTSGQSVEDSLWEIKIVWYRHENKNDPAKRDGIPPVNWEPKEYLVFKCFGLPISHISHGQEPLEVFTKEFGLQVTDVERDLSSQNYESRMNGFRRFRGEGRDATRSNNNFLRAVVAQSIETNNSTGGSSSSAGTTASRNNESVLSAEERRLLEAQTETSQGIVTLLQRQVASDEVAIRHRQLAEVRSHLTGVRNQILDMEERYVRVQNDISIRDENSRKRALSTIQMHLDDANEEYRINKRNLRRLERERSDSPDATDQDGEDEDYNFHTGDSH